jgi:hypothetical protein
MSISDAAFVVTAVATWVLALAAILYTRRSWDEQRKLVREGWDEQRRQAQENWQREQVVRLIVVLQSNRARLGELASDFEAELSDRRLFSPAESFLVRKRQECDDLMKLVRAMGLDVRMLCEIATGTLQRRAYGLRLGLSECDGSLVDLWGALIPPDSGLTDDVWPEVERLRDDWIKNRDHLAQLERDVMEAARPIVSPRCAGSPEVSSKVKAKQ